MDTDRIEHLKLIQATIGRLATSSFQLKGWAVTLATALQVFLEGHARAIYLFVPALPIVAFWFLDAYYLRQERLFRALYDSVHQTRGRADFSMETGRFHNTVRPVIQTAVSASVGSFYGPILGVLLLLELFLFCRVR